jgi:hypothetical protein
LLKAFFSFAPYYLHEAYRRISHIGTRRRLLLLVSRSAIVGSLME